MNMRRILPSLAFALIALQASNALAVPPTNQQAIAQYNADQNLIADTLPLDRLGQDLLTAIYLKTGRPLVMMVNKSDSDIGAECLMFKGSISTERLSPETVRYAGLDLTTYNFTSALDAVLYAAILAQHDTLANVDRDYFVRRCTQEYRYLEQQPSATWEAQLDNWNPAPSPKLAQAIAQYRMDEHTTPDTLPMARLGEDLATGILLDTGSLEWEPPYKSDADITRECDYLRIIGPTLLSGLNDPNLPSSLPSNMPSTTELALSHLEGGNLTSGLDALLYATVIKNANLQPVSDPDPDIFKREDKFHKACVDSYHRIRNEVASNPNQ